MKGFAFQFAVSTAVILTCGADGRGDDASFQGIGFFPAGDSSDAFAVSADGNVIVGTASTGSPDILPTFWWTETEGMNTLGPIVVNQIIPIQAYGTSGDGAIVVGWATDLTFQTHKGFLWTSDGGVFGLGGLAGGSGRSEAFAISSNGNVVVGKAASSSGDQAFRWTSEGGIEGLGDLNGGVFFSEALAVSSNGDVIVGASSSSNSGSSSSEAFVWTEADGMVGLGGLPGGFPFSKATGVSADGNVIVGQGVTPTGQEAFRWTSQEGMMGLGDVPGGPFNSEAFGTSSNGLIVVGRSKSSIGDEAFIWTTEMQMRSLSELLTTDYGLDLTGWRLKIATGISGDGRTIVGRGTNPNGRDEGWVVRLPNLANQCQCPGDLNDDGEINGNDIHHVITCLLSSGSSCQCAELDGTPGLSTNDAIVFVASLLSGDGCL